MAKKKIIDILEEKKNKELKTALVVTKITASLHAQVRERMIADGYTWNDLIEAGITQYLEERSAKKQTS